MSDEIAGVEEEEIIEALGDSGEDAEVKNKKGKKVKIKVTRIDPVTVVDDGDVEV